MVNPKMPIPYGASEVHHIYDVDVKNAPYIEEVIEEIMTYINTPDIII
jgi:DNA polymerase III epsilon subunit-like protein